MQVLGKDHPETAHSHSFLALYLNQLDRPDLALKHIKRALYLFELLCGSDHPDTAAAHINTAMVYQVRLLRYSEGPVLPTPFLRRSRGGAIACGVAWRCTSHPLT